jgi:hypothetical protein
MTRFPFSLHRRIPYVRRPFFQRDLALAQRDAAIAERDMALNELAAKRAIENTVNPAFVEPDVALNEAPAVHVREHAFHSYDSLKRLPWYSINEVPDVGSGQWMISPDERRLLYTLAKDYYSGTGRIVDGGSFLGSSAFALGQGLRDRAYTPVPVIDAFDLFLIDAHSIQHHLAGADGAKVKPGDDVRYIFERNTSAISQYIDVHQGDIRAKPWSKGPIEIIFNDLSKGWSTNDYIITNWLPALIPGRGILIQQDQLQEWHVWLSISMEILSEYFEFIDFVHNCSMVYRLLRPIPESALRQCLRANLTPEQMIHYYTRFLDRFRRVGMGRYSDWHLGMAEAGLVVTTGLHAGERDRALGLLRSCEQKFRNIPDTLSRLATIRGYLEHGGLFPGHGL